MDKQGKTDNAQGQGTFDNTWTWFEINNRFKRNRETDGIMKMLDKKCIFNVLSSNLDVKSSGIMDL